MTSKEGSTGGISDGPFQPQRLGDGVDLPRHVSSGPAQHAGHHSEIARAGAGPGHHFRPDGHQRQKTAGGDRPHLCGIYPEHAGAFADVLFVLHAGVQRFGGGHHRGGRHHAGRLHRRLYGRGGARRHPVDPPRPVRGRSKPGLWLCAVHVLHHPAAKHQDHSAAHGQPGGQPVQEHQLPVHRRRRRPDLADLQLCHRRHHRRRLCAGLPGVAARCSLSSASRCPPCHSVGDLAEKA